MGGRLDTRTRKTTQQFISCWIGYRGKRSYWVQTPSNTSRILRIDISCTGRCFFHSWNTSDWNLDHLHERIALRNGMEGTQMSCISRYMDRHQSFINLKSTVDGRNPAPVEGTVVYLPLFTRFWHHPRWLFGISSINSIICKRIAKGMITYEDLLCRILAWMIMVALNYQEFGLTFLTPQIVCILCIFMI